MPYELNPHDVEQKYQHTIMEVNNDLYQVNYIYPSLIALKNEYSLVAINDHKIGKFGKKPIMVLDNDRDFVFTTLDNATPVYPETGYVNVNDGAMFVSRIVKNPSSKFKIGFYPRNYQYSNAFYAKMNDVIAQSRTIIHKLTVFTNSHAFSYDMFRWIYYKTYPSINKAIERLFDPKDPITNLAVSKSIMLSVDIMRDDLLIVYHNETIIGMVLESDRNNIILLDSLIELCDEINALGISTELVSKRSIEELLSNQEEI